MVTYTTYALYRKGCLFQKVTFTKILKTLRFVLLLVRARGPREGAVCLEMCRVRQCGDKGTCIPISVPAQKAVAAQKH